MTSLRLIGRCGRARMAGLLVMFAALALGCSRPDNGWRSLWGDEQQRIRFGWRWEMCVPADGRSIEVEAGAVLRFALVNTSSDPVTLLLAGPERERSWRVDGEGVLPVEVTLDSGGLYEFSGPPTAMLGSPRLGRVLDRPKLIVLIVADTLRNDHVRDETMPGVSRFFTDGRRWLDVSSTASWTLPSMSSLFTSRPVLELSTPEGGVIGPPEGWDTWSKALADYGLSGGAAVANYTVHVQNGFAQGFATYWVPEKDEARGFPDAAWVVERAREWLARHRGENGFLYLHFMDPHAPYRDHSGAGEPPLSIGDLMSGQHVPGPEEARATRERYAGEVRHLDRVLMTLLNELPEHGVVAFTADHGESLGEHGRWGHGPSVYQAEISVPLLLRGPGVPPGSVEQGASLVDLGPTLLQLADVPPSDGLKGRSLLDGGSDLPHVSATFSSGPMMWSWRRGADKVVLQMAPQPGLGADSRTKFLVGSPPSPGAYVYSIDSDPGERSPRPLSGELLEGAGRAFATSAGRMVPGVQLMVWGARDGVEVEVGLNRGVEVVQAWAVAPLSWEHQEGRGRLVAERPYPVCAVACRAPSATRVRPIESGTPWWGVSPGEEYRLESLSPPSAIRSGVAMVWANEERLRVIGSFQTTIERLRALGYVE